MSFQAIMMQANKLNLLENADFAMNIWQKGLINSEHFYNHNPWKK
jgi:hypothetical protein